MYNIKIIHFLYNKLFDNDISKFTALGRHPLPPSLPDLLKVIQNPEYARLLDMLLLGVIQKPEYSRGLNIPLVLNIREC